MNVVVEDASREHLTNKPEQTALPFVLRSVRGRLAGFPDPSESHFRAASGGRRNRIPRLSTNADGGRISALTRIRLKTPDHEFLKVVLENSQWPSSAFATGRSFLAS
jgi:hypothetical protein